MNSSEKKELGIRIKALRSKSGLSQMQVAEKLGFDNRTSYSNYEIGRTAPPFEVLKKIASLFNTTTDYLLGNTENPDPVDPEAEFHKDIELSDEALLDKYNFTVDGRPVDGEALKTILEYLRVEKRLKG